MSEENKAVIGRWIEAFNERDLEAEADVLAPGFVAHVPDAPAHLDLEGLEAWRQFTAPFVEAFPDLRLTIQDIAAEGDTVAARVAFRGTHRGEFQSLPPTGKQVASRAWSSTAWWTARWRSTGSRLICSVWCSSWA